MGEKDLREIIFEGNKFIFVLNCAINFRFMNGDFFSLIDAIERSSEVPLGCFAT